MTLGRTAMGVWTVGLLAAAAAPSPGSRVFDGLPWTSLPELVLVITAAGVLGSSAARERIGRRLGRGSPGVSAGVLALPIVVLGLKLAAGSIAAPAGFAACYGSLVPGKPGPPCERSFDAPFAPPVVTRYDHTIDFAPDAWHLGFVNSSRFNFHRRGEIDRQRLPFRAAWVGEVELAAGDRVEVRYVGEGSVQLGRMAALQPPDYKGQSVALSPAAGRQRLAASFRYDDGSRVGARADGPGPEFHVDVIGADGQRRPLMVRRGGIGSTVVVTLLDATMALSILVLVAGLANVVKALVAVAFGSVWLAFVLETGLSPWMSFYVLLAAAVAASMFSWARRPGVLLPVAIAVAGMFTRWRMGSWTTMVVRSGGDDWLTFESQARTILETGSLEGGEAVFYYQPFYRYAKYALRMLLGEADFLTHTAMSVGLFGGVLVLTALMAVRLAPSARWLPPLTACAMLAIVCSNWLHSVTLRGLSESVSWVLFPWAIALLFGGRSYLMQALGVVGAALSGITRLNHVPAILLTFAAFLLRGAPRPEWRSLPLAIPLAAILLLPLAHNLVYGRAFVLTTRSIEIPQNLVISPRQLLHIGSEPRTRAALAGQLRRMLNVQAGLWSPDLLLIGLRQSEALWGGAILMALWRRTWYHASVALLPASYLVVHVFYQLNTYHPRHIIAAHLAMAVSACLVALPSAPGPSQRA